MSRPPFGVAVPENRWDLLDGTQPDEPRAVTVVVTHFEQPECLARTLAALRRQTHPADRLEVVVADDGSAEPPVVPSWVRLLRQPDRGFRAAAARNLGASAATGDVLVFLDADTTPEPSYVEQLVRLPSLAPETITVGRRAHADFGGVDPTEPVQSVGPVRRLPAPAWLDDAYARSRNLLHADDTSYRFVLGAVTACSRWFFEEIGGFDESFTSYGGEDWEWADRAWRHGGVLAHVPDAVAWHEGPDWAGRSKGDRRAKNVETSKLMRLGLPTLRARGLRLCDPEVEIVVESAPSPEAALLGTDVLLASLPDATVRLPSSFAAALGADPRVQGPLSPARGLPRVRVSVTRPVRIDPNVLRDAVRRIREQPLGALRLTDRQGRLVMTLTLMRAAERARRWSRPDLFTTSVEAVDVVDVPEVPDLEGYLAGWS